MCVCVCVFAVRCKFNLLYLVTTLQTLTAPVTTNGWGLVATMCFMAATGDVWIIQYFRILDYMLHVEHISGTSPIFLPTSVNHLFSSLNRSWGLTLPEIHNPYLETYSSKVGFSRLILLYYLQLLPFLLTFFMLVCYCSVLFYYSQGISWILELL